jgi:hypothetical protein
VPRRFLVEISSSEMVVWDVAESRTNIKAIPNSKAKGIIINHLSLSLAIAKTSPNKRIPKTRMIKASIKGEFLYTRGSFMVIFLLR